MTAGIVARSLMRLMLLLGSALLLACGQTGPLYLPEDAPGEPSVLSLPAAKPAGDASNETDEADENDADGPQETPNP